MTKSRVKELADKYGMEIMRNEVTGEGVGVRVESTDIIIPELDEIVDSMSADTLPCGAERIAANKYEYRIYCPRSWFDLWGWADD